MVPSAFEWRTRGQSIEGRLAAVGFVGPGFDAIRLLAAVTVLLHHSHGGADPLHAYSREFLHFGLLAVLVFFSISGFLVAPGLARSGNIIDYASSRALRIFPALITVVLSSMAVLGPILTTLPAEVYFSDPRMYLYSKNILTLTYDYLPGVLSGNGNDVIINGALWTLHFEVLSYVALAIISLSGGLRRPRIVLCLFMASYALYVANTFFPVVVNMQPARFVTFVSLFVYFAAGVTLYTYRDIVPYSGATAGLVLMLWMTALPLGAGAVATPLCLPYLVIFAGLSNLPGRSILKRDISYGVYLIHAPVLSGLSIINPGVKPWWVVALIVALVTFPLSYLSCILVEQPALARRKTFANWIRGRLHRLQITGTRWMDANAVRAIGPLRPEGHGIKAPSLESETPSNEQANLIRR